jgi:hypothetical protein
MRAAFGSFCALGTLCLLLVGVSARADTEAPGAKPRAMALGFQLDLFPTVISAINGELGYAPQVWLGIDHARLRVIGAHLEPPDALAFADAGFENPTTTVFVVSIDYTFGGHFDGWWLGGGFEVWQRTIEHVGVEGKAAWSSTIATFGGGYIWRFAGNFFLDPWLGVHATLNPESVQAGPYEYAPPAVVANASVKIGVFVDL